MNVFLAVCAAATATDRFSNRLSIFNILEQIPSASFPIWIPELTFAVILRRGPNDPQRFQSTAQIRLGNQVIATIQVAVDFENGQFARQIMNFQGLPVAAPGELEFHLPLPDGGTATVSLPVLLLTPPVQAPVQAPSAVR